MKAFSNGRHYLYFGLKEGVRTVKTMDTFSECVDGSLITTVECDCLMIYSDDKVQRLYSVAGTGAYNTLEDIRNDYVNGVLDIVESEVNRK